MNGETAETELSLQEMFRSGGRRFGLRQIVANLIGACAATSYFVFFDQAFPVLTFKNTFYVVGRMFPLLCGIAAGLLHGWQKDLVRFIRLKAQGRNINDSLQSKARRKILNLPLILTGNGGTILQQGPDDANYESGGCYSESVVLNPLVLSCGLRSQIYQKIKHG